MSFHWRCFFALIVLFSLFPTEGFSQKSGLFQTIAEEVAAGHISQPQAALYRLLALRAPQNLPPFLRNIPREPIRCATPIFREARHYLAQLSVLERATASEALITPCDRPAEDWSRFVASSRYPVRVHYQADQDRAVAESTLEFLEQSWKIEVEDIKFRAPLPDQGFCGSDALDIFIDYSLDYAYTDMVSDNPDTSWDDYSAYIVIDPDAYGGELLDSTTAHEFNHVLQAADDWWDAASSFEMTATYIEDIVFDDDNGSYDIYEDFQKHPDLPLSFNDYYRTWYMYGSAIYLFFLRDRYAAGDSTFVADMWRNSRNPARGSNINPSTNEPDFIDALDLVLQDLAGISFVESYTEFARWRWFVGPYDDGAHFEEGGAWPDSATVKIRQEIERLPANIIVSQGPANVASEYIVVNLPPASDARQIVLDFSGEDGRSWEVDTLRYSGDFQDGWQVGVSGPTGHWSVDVTGASKLVIAIINQGDGSFDPDFPDWHGHSYRLDLSLAASRCALVTDQKRMNLVVLGLLLLPLGLIQKKK
jgi:hypothetical protein